MAIADTRDRVRGIPKRVAYGDLSFARIREARGWNESAGRVGRWVAREQSRGTGRFGSRAEPPVLAPEEPKKGRLVDGCWIPERKSDFYEWILDAAGELGLEIDDVWNMSIQHVKMRLKSMERLEARRELKRLNTLIRVEDAASGSKGGNKRLEKYSKKLESQSGWGLTPEQEKEKNAIELIEKMKLVERRKAATER